MIAVQAPDRGVLFVVSGPSGVGKSTLLSRVFERVPGLSFSVSATSFSISALAAATSSCESGNPTALPTPAHTETKAASPAPTIPIMKRTSAQSTFFATCRSSMSCLLHGEARLPLVNPNPHTRPRQRHRHPFFGQCSPRHTM